VGYLFQMLTTIRIAGSVFLVLCGASALYFGAVGSFPSRHSVFAPSAAQQRVLDALKQEAEQASTIATDSAVQIGRFATNLKQTHGEDASKQYVLSLESRMKLLFDSRDAIQRLYTERYNAMRQEFDDQRSAWYVWPGRPGAIGIGCALAAVGFGVFPWRVRHSPRFISAAGAGA
jgi:hypothetical protein